MFEKWGWPPVVFDKDQPRLVLQDLLQPPGEVQELFLCKKRFPVTWDEEALLVPVATYGEVGNVVGHVGLAAQWGTRVYRHVLPATKASSFGVAGRTHLVAQRYNGEWRARTLSVHEVKAWCTSARVELTLPADPETAMSALGNSGPARMVLPFADGLTKYCAPPLPVVPACVDEVVAPEAVVAFRGAMCLTHLDFQKRAEAK